MAGKRTDIENVQENDLGCVMLCFTFQHNLPGTRKPISLIKKRKRDTGLNRTVKITFMSETVFILTYFSLNALSSLLYLIGDTSPVFHVIQPMIPVVCWLCVGTSAVSVIFVGLVWAKNQISLKTKLTLSGLIALFFPISYLRFL
jgi:hypothetical protein